MNESELAQVVWEKAAPWLAYIGAARLVMKPVAARICAAVEKAISKSKETESKEDDRLIAKLIGSKPYLWTAWLFDYLLSVKLPTTTKPQDEKPT